MYMLNYFFYLICFEKLKNSAGFEDHQARFRYVLILLCLLCFRVKLTVKHSSQGSRCRCFCRLYLVGMDSLAHSSEIIRESIKKDISSDLESRTNI